MSQFAYEGVDKTGEKTSGVVNADSFRAAARQLESRNLKIIALDAVSSNAEQSVKLSKKSYFQR